MTASVAIGHADQVLRVSEVAHHLDCADGIVYSLIRNGELRAIRLGRLIRVPESALADFIAGGQLSTATARP